MQLYDTGAQLVSPKDQCMKLKSILYRSLFEFIGSYIDLAIF